ncbi:peptidase A24 [Methylobacterium sp. Leaf123]|uniref:prepilin peptidase n=1 Tax=Methylobacterium sp. Leaf123 TaxID=1736264 RepID=UPI0006FFF6FF|nr:A24 family peptidase [Methylobacterium sp. Leaf123]KQQ25369.1 peptidase A24 [Methylobacterium sp. Leaf123]
MSPDLSELFFALLPLPLTVAAATIDLRRRIIPDRVNLALLVLGLGASLLRGPALPQLGASLAAAAAAFLLLWSLRAAYARLRGRTGLGLGDVKFIAAAAAWTGLAGLPLMILVASLSALAAVGLAVLAGRRLDGTSRLPFAPFLALGLHVALLAGHTA